MAIFAVVSILPASPNVELGKAVEKHFSGKHFQLNDGHWLVSSPGTAQEISTQLGVQGGQYGQAIVYTVSGYFGYTKNSAWEWLKTNLSSGSTASG
jgi:hypothetical protein